MVEKTDYYVYVIYKADGVTPCSVGKGRRYRVMDHFKENRCHNRALRQEVEAAGGRLPFAYVQTGMRESEAFDLEVRFIEEIGSGYRGSLFNASSGGEGVASGAPRTEAWERKIGEKTAARMWTPEARAAMSARWKGVSKSAEPVAKRVSSRKGWRHTDEAKRKIAIALTSRKRPPMSDEQKAKLSAAHRGKKLSPEHAAKVVAALHSHMSKAKTLATRRKPASEIVSW